jgi:hypothetical protein
MGPTTQVSITFFKSTIYAFVVVAQGLDEIVMSTIVIMTITDLATFCYSRARMQAKNAGRLTRQAGSMLKWLVLNPIRVAGSARSLT